MTNDELKERIADLERVMRQGFATITELHLDLDRESKESQRRLTESQQRLTELQQRLTKSQQRLTESQQRLTESQQRHTDSITRLNNAMAHLAEVSAGHEVRIQKLEGK